jgi:hypothetical protein
MFTVPELFSSEAVFVCDSSLTGGLFLLYKSVEMHEKLEAAVPAQ